MSNFLLIIEIILGILLCVLTIESYLFFKKNENKKIEKIRKKLLLRMNIAMIIMISIGIIAIINVVINK